jgi:hypothetical protein
LAVQGGERIVILSDRDLPEGLIPIPALLAVSAVNAHLVRASRPTSFSLVVEPGEARDVMHVAMLVGYGAAAVNPYLAYETVADLASRGGLSREVERTTAVESYISALRKGLLKVMSKMGISTLRSYRGAQIFEAVGLSREVVQEYFPVRLRGSGHRAGGDRPGDEHALPVGWAARRRRA